MFETATELHIWRARLDADGWPSLDGLPDAERDRAAGMGPGKVRERWVAARWALRAVLGRYLELEPVEVELRLASRGKPMLASPGPPLRFNLSHSRDLALVALAREREVGVDVERIGKRPAAFYVEWTRHEATVKCHGTGLRRPMPDLPVAVANLDAGPGFAAAVAVAGDVVPPLRHFILEPGALAVRDAPARR
jgi:phosphopantetheinyl transferase